MQGVGFRPFVYRLARELGLGGYVLNDARGVLLEVEGAGRVGRRVPRAAARRGAAAGGRRAGRSSSERRCRAGERRLRDRRERRAARPRDAPVTPDSATCDDCLRELLDPADRRYRYPFINCTNCGPRFTIVRGVPYDRPLTTMAGFAMCPACRREYEDPGRPPLPRAAERLPGVRAAVGAARSRGRACRRPVAIRCAAAARALRAGRIVAVKGIGGYHLACRADDEAAVAALRARKHREDKPFALMAPDRRRRGGARRARRCRRASRCSRSAARPIVLAPRRARRGAPRSPPSVAPGAPELGVMLPYSPLHHLLLARSSARRS